MSEPIPFPKNYDYYVQQGQLAIEKNEWIAGVSFFQAAYDIHQTFAVNLLLVHAYLEVGENQAAEVLMSEMTENYLNDFSSAELYLQVLICNTQFLSAYEWLRKLAEYYPENIVELEMLTQQLEQTELAYQQFEAKKIKQLKEQLQTIENCSGMQQLTIAKKMLALPKEDFTQVSKKVLMNPAVHWLVRSWFLEELAAINVTEVVELLNWTNQIQQVIPAKVGRPIESIAYKEIINYLEEECSNQNPTLFEGIYEEVKLHCALLYPYIDETIQEPELWAQVYLYKYDIQKQENTSIDSKALTKIQEKQQWLQEQMTTLFT